MVGRSRPLRNNRLNGVIAAPQPRASVPARFRLVPVRSPLLGESHLLSFPPGTKMFQFPGCPLTQLCIHCGVTEHYFGRVPPFGNLEIIACLQLPREYRRYRVLHRHFAPRHPPDALCSLKNKPQTTQTTLASTTPTTYITNGISNNTTKSPCS
jgi:hypothetical protein